MTVRETKVFASRPPNNKKQRTGDLSNLSRNAKWKVKLPPIVIIAYIVDYSKCIKIVINTTVNKEARVT